MCVCADSSSISGPAEGAIDMLDVPFVVQLASSDGLRQMLKLTFFQAI